ncbi:nitrogenase iron protein NifH [Ureibacillus terrenus]|uniref:nitrogenase iron protein NifH n=1 Tax=Ureibacillus terrenus TaxID=118246 RepID=UPI002E1E9030|nr:nitrogenase iron protein NifH [Ureibacillus terrenus]
MITNTKPIKRIAIYGKGGIGKSTISANLSAALSERGLKVMQIGCDPKADSTMYLAREKVPTVLNVLKEKKNAIQLSDFVKEGFNGVLCVEVGGPTPGAGCAGQGIIAAFQQMKKLNAIETYQPDVVIYDVLGDVVCGGFAVPLRDGYAEDVYIISSGERMSLYAAYNISRAVQNFRSRGYATLKGLIFNSKGGENEVQRVHEALEEIGTNLFHKFPRDPVVQQCEKEKKTVIEGAPNSKLANEYRELARKVMEQ